MSPGLIPPLLRTTGLVFLGPLVLLFTDKLNSSLNCYLCVNRVVSVFLLSISMASLKVCLWQTFGQGNNGLRSGWINRQIFLFVQFLWSNPLISFLCYDLRKLLKIRYEGWWSACLASMRPWVQTQVLSKKIIHEIKSSRSYFPLNNNCWVQNVYLYPRTISAVICLNILLNCQGAVRGVDR
jgi:hypothetical protein